MIPEHVRKSISKKLQDQGASKAYIFGSYARGDQSETSDIDLLVEFSSPKSLIELSLIEQELTDEIGIQVDLVTRNSVSKQILPYIEEDLVEVKV